MKWSLCLLKVLLLVLTCLPNTESKKRNPSCPLKKPFKTLTYNALLADTAWDLKSVVIPNNRVERRDALIDYLKTTDACVVCLQEVYLGPDIEAIVDGLSDKFPHAQSQLHLFNGVLPPQVAGVRRAVCDVEVVIVLLTCALGANCYTLGGSFTEFAQCMRQFCEAEVFALFSTGGTKCMICLLNGFPADVNGCGETDPVTDNFDINPSGLLLLSKKPMSNRQFVPHYQGVIQSVQRGYLQATIDEKILFACSQQTPTDLVSFEPILDLIIPNTQLQNDYEISDLIRRLSGEKALVLLGELHVGGSSPGVLPVNEERYKRLEDAFNTCPVKQCTVCADNLYNGFDDANVDVNIDHIFTSNPLKVTNPKIVLKVDDASVDVSGTPYPLSDHYGLEATITCSGRSNTKHRRSSKHGHKGYRRYA